MIVFLYVSDKIIGHFTRPSALCIKYLIFKFFLELPRADNNDELMLLVDIQQLRPNMTFYCEVIFSSWGGRIFYNV